MRVLLVNDYSVETGYGAEAYVRRLAAGLAAAGDEVLLWAGEVIHEGAGRWRDVWDPAARRGLARRIDEWGPDIVHFHNIVRECSASVLTAVRQAPAVLTVHDHRILGVPDQRGRGLSGWLNARGAKLAGRTVARTARRQLAATMAVSDELADLLRAGHFPEVSVVPVPVEQPVDPPKPVAGCSDIAFVGRLSGDKGPDVAISAFRRIAAGYPRTQLVMAGDGPMRPELERLAQPMDGRVQFLGRLDPAEVSRLIGAARFVVAPSVPYRRPEGSPIVVGETAAHGRPLIASDDPGLRAAAERLGGTITVPAGDVGALAAAMSQLLSDDHQVATLGAAAHAAVFARHGLDVVTAAVRQVYRGAIER